MAAILYGVRESADWPGELLRSGSSCSAPPTRSRPRPRDDAQDAADFGYGELAYFNAAATSPALQTPAENGRRCSSTRTIDLEPWRTRGQQRLKMDFVFASTAGKLGLNRTNETLDGDVAYPSAGDSSPPLISATPSPQPAELRRPASACVELLAHPVTIVRAALDPASKLSTFAHRNLQLVDVTGVGRHADNWRSMRRRIFRLGQLCRARMQTRGRDVPHRIPPLSAGARRAAADRLRHHNPTSATL